MSLALPLDQQIAQYLGHLNVQQKRVVLSVVKTLAQKEEEWWDAVEEDAAKSIGQALKEVKEGKVTPHKEVMKKYKKWLSQ